MSLSFHTPLALVLILTFISFAAAYFLYKYTVPQVTTARRMLLIALRGSALTCILVAVCEPLFRITTTTEERPVVAVLADNSLSMSQSDRMGNKEKTLKSLLTGKSLQKLSASMDLRYFSFSSSTEQIMPESLTVTGGATNISEALQTSGNTIEHLRGIILLSDGNYNAGTNPLYAAEKSKIPIFTVGIGDTIDQKDVAVSKLLTNSIGYVKTAIPVDASVKVSGLSKRTLTVMLSEEGKIIDQKTVVVSGSDGVEELSVNFSYVPSSEGIKKISVSVGTTDGETTEKNNVRSAVVKVLKSKMNVVVVAGSVSPDVGAVMQILNADANILAGLFYQLPEGEFKQQSGSNGLQASLGTADAIIFIGYPSPSSSAASMQTIVRIISERSVPVLFIAGRELDLQKLRSMEQLLPFSVASERIDEQSVLPVASPLTRTHLLLNDNRELWQKLPPVFYSLQTFTSKPEALQLLSVSIQNVRLPYPLFLVRTIGSMKSAALLGYGLYRWNILAAASDETKGMFGTWLSSVIRWLATREQDDFLRIEPSSEFYASGERVTFTGQVYNESYQPIENAEVSVVLRSISTGERFNATLAPLGSGLYEGFLDGLPEGDFLYAAAALDNGDTAGTATGRINIGEQSIEFSETTMNKGLLRQLADASGGLYADAASFDRIVKEIEQSRDFQPRMRTRSSEFELWNLPLFLSIIVLLFGIEWLVRKQSGML